MTRLTCSASLQPLPQLLLLLLSVMIAVARAQSSASTRVVVSDLAGMLYPSQQQYELVDFGTSQSANFFASINNELSPDDTGATSPGATAASSTPCGSNLCVDLVFTSVFEADPFLLTRYESRYPVTSSLSDGQTLDANAIQPVVTGSSNNSDASAPVQTWWRFSTNASDASNAPTIDLLLRLKQQSQFKSTKDQLLVHFVAKRKSEFSVTTAIESYSVYGNARISHETKRMDSTRVQIALTIARNATQRDVNTNDAYPFAVKYEISPSAAENGNKWMYEQPECAQCAALLYNCSTVDDLQSGLCDYDSTDAPLVRCMRDGHDLTSANYKSLLELNEVGFDISMESMLLSCYDTVIEEEDTESLTSSGLPATAPLHTRKWWNSTSAMSCLAHHSCPFGPFNSIYLQNASPTKMLTLTNTTEFTHTARIYAATFSGYFEVSFGASSSSPSASGSPASVLTRDLTDKSSQIEFAAALHDAIAIPELPVSVQKTFDGVDVWELRVVISSLLFPNLVAHFNLSTFASDFEESHETTTFSTLTITPFNATQLKLQDKCDVCVNHLDECQQSEQCRETVLPCLITQFTNVIPQQRGQVVYVPEFGKSRLDVLNSFTECTSQLSVATWNAVRKAFLCVAQQSCVVGSNSISNLPNVFKVENATQVFVVPLDAAGVDSVNLNFSRVVSGTSQSQQQIYKFQSSISTLPLFIRAFVLQNGADITQSSRVEPQDPSQVEITLQYANLLGALPHIEAADGTISWIQNAPAKVYFEYTDESESDNENALPTLTTLLEMLQAKALPLSSVGAPANHSWSLSSDCVGCSAKLFSCTAADVTSRTCHYNSMASPFGRCLREQLPSSVYQDLLNATSVSSTESTASLEVRNIVAYCAQQVTSASATTSATAASSTSVVALNAALGCFTATKCPFGPLEVIESRQVILLDTSSYVQVVRVHDRVFEITLQFRFADVDAFAQVTFTQTTTRIEVLELLTTNLAASGVVPSIITYEREAEGAEWIMEFRYDNAVLPGFSVNIASTSLPAKTAIEQIRMKASPRLSVAVRNPLNLYKLVNVSSGPIPTPPKSGFNYSNFVFTGYSSCPECPDSYMEACRRSPFCHTTMLPCFIQRLESFGNGTETTMDIDVTAWLQSCAAQSSGSAFANWWAPLQRFLACYARSQCKLSRLWLPLSGQVDATDLSSTVLRVQQGEETLFVPVDASSQIFSLDVFPPAQGTNFAVTLDVFSFTGNSSRLEQLLAYLTMDTASNMTVTLAAEPSSATGLTQLQISYGDDYLGLLPHIAPRDNGFSNGPTPPRLLATSTPASATAVLFPLDWSGLTKVLNGTGSLPFAGSSCTSCEEQFLSVCRSDADCSAVVLECARTKFTRNAMSDADKLLFGLDRDILTNLLQCANGVSLPQSSLFQSFVACFEQAQCQANDATAASPIPSYLRLQRGKIEFFLPLPADSFAATIDVPETGSGPAFLPFQGSLDSLQALLVSLTDNTASVAIHSWQVGDDSVAGTLGVQITYDGYYGVIPKISVTSNAPVDSAVVHTQPRMILFSTSGRSPNADTLVDTIAAYSARPECSTVCSDHLSACEKGDSRASLVCREFSLMCLNMMLNGLPPQNSPSDFATGLRTCASATILAAAIPLADFILCYEQNKCPLNSLGAPTSLRIISGSETLRIPVDYPATLSISPPTDSTATAVVDKFEFTGDLHALETSLQATVLESRALVQVEALSMDSQYSEIVITYTNYLGEPPTVSGQNIDTLNHALPQALTISRSTSEVQTWDRFQARLQERLQHITDERANCDTCATTYLSSCPVCTTALSCLVQKLQPPISSEVTPTTGSLTGTNFTSALRSCVSGYAVGDWHGLGSFFNCLMENSCPVSAVSLGYSEENSTFVVLHEGVEAFEVENSQLPVTLTIIAPSELSGSVDSVPLDLSDSFSQLSTHLNTLLKDQGAGENLVTVANSLVFRDSVLLRNFTINYKDYFGLLPAVTGSDVALLTVQHPQFSFQSLNGLARWDHLFELLDPVLGASPTSSPGDTSAPSTPPPTVTRVLKNACRTCGAGLFGCDQTAIADGSCSYENPTSLFAQSLAQTIPASFYAMVLSPDGTDGVAVNNPLIDSFSGIETADQSANAASFTGDLWYAASEALACFDVNGCPLGPLQSSITSDNRMVHLASAATTRLFSIDGETFSAVFTAKYGFRELTSPSEFTESSTDVQLKAILMDILPSSAVVIIAMVARSDNSGFDVTLGISLLYFPTFEIGILVSGTTSVTGTITDPWSAKLIATTLDISTITTVS
ncbi:hypothetical protein Gpo141_00012172 [Globisporangium polare]